jgi:diguanylate cyclase (GGDEF)-like protein
MAIVNSEGALGKNTNNLPKLLTPIESLSFSLASHITWLIGAPIIIYNLGFSSMYIWVTGSIVAILNLLLVQHIALKYPQISGGVSSYITRLYPPKSFISKYASIAYFLGWTAIPAASTLLLSVFISHIFQFQVHTMVAKFLQIFFILLISSIGFSSNKLLSIFHTILTIPSVLTTVIFTFISFIFILLTNSHYIGAESYINIASLGDIFKYFFISSIIIFTGDIATSFAADSTKPIATIKSIRFSMVFLPFIYILGSWILLKLSAGKLDYDIYNVTSLLSNNIFGPAGLFFTTVWVGSSLFLSCATVISHAPRVIYQLALDERLNPIFRNVSSRGSLIVATSFTMLISIFYVFLNNIETLLIVATVPYFISYIIFHFGMLISKQKQPKYIKLAAIILVPFEIICFTLGLFQINHVLILAGLASPLIILIIDKIIPDVKKFAKPRLYGVFKSNLLFQSVDNTVILLTQVVLLLIVEIVTILTTWFVVLFIVGESFFYKLDHLAFILVASCFTTIAIAASTIFPQIQNLDNTTKRLAEVNTMLEKDIQRRIIAENALLTITTHDDLTGLGNRKLLAEYILSYIKKIKKKSISQFGIMMLNLNRFKSINDSLGNKIGDELLKSVANRLKATVSDEYDIYRVGSDEFAILIPDLKSRDLLMSVTQDILSSFTFPFLVKGRQLFITASVGVNLIHDGDLSVDGVLSETNIALLEAKKIGKNRHSFFDREQYDRVQNLLNLETNLPNAIKNKEFELYYQPIVNLNTNKISGYETLVRWAHGNDTLLPPSSFIPLAEETDLVVPLTWQILERACLDMREFQKHFNNDNLRVNVNFSLKQFFEPDLVKRIINIAKKAELSVSCIKIEITESMLQDSEDLKYVMNELSDNNIKLNLDDFGTGYSSLGYLNTLPISALKIDKSFIRGLNPKSLEITQAMINLAKNIGAWTIVEGIETQEQLKIVKEMKADFGQGYYFGRAMPASEVFTFKYPKD